MVNQSASFIGTVEFKNGNRTRIWIGANSNTGETVVWQQTLFSGKAQWNRDSRVTGRNIRKFADELNFVLKEGEAKWVERPNDAAFDALMKLIQD